MMPKPSSTPSVPTLKHSTRATSANFSTTTEITTPISTKRPQLPPPFHTPKTQRLDLIPRTTLSATSIILRNPGIHMPPMQKPPISIPSTLRDITNSFHRIQQLRDDLSYHILVPGTQRQRFDNILKDHNRQTAAIHDLTRFPSRVQQCLQDFADMNQLTHSSKTPLTELPVYDKWHRNAQQLSELGQELINNQIAFTPYFEEVSNSWKQVAQSIIAVDTALNNNTAFRFTPTSILNQSTEPSPRQHTKLKPTTNTATSANSGTRI